MEQNNSFLPYGRQVIDDDDIAAVADVLRSPYLTTGPTIAAFESAFAEWIEAPNAVVVANGTAALHLAAIGLGLRPGDQVIVPAITFVATANAARYVGADVIFADVDPETGLMRPQDLEDALKRADDKRIKAVFNVHFGGQTENLELIRIMTDAAGLILLDDACHAIGTRFDGSPIGSCDMTDMTVFSFHPVKTLAMGEGGMITTPDADLARRLRELRAHGISHDPETFRSKRLGFDGDAPNPWYHEMHHLGFNYRATDIQCALGLSQLKKADGFVERRRQLVACYDEMLGGLKHVRPVTRHRPEETGWHLNTVLIDFEALGRSRRDVMLTLRDHGIGTQVHYIPVPLQPYYRALYGREDLPGANAYYDACLSLPLAADMTEKDVERVVGALRAL